MVTETISAPRNKVSGRNGEDLPGAGAIAISGGLILRFARDADASAVIKLISAVWSEYPGKTLVAADDMPELLAPAASYAAKNGRFWVVEAHRRIVGTVALAPGAEPGVVELQKLYVARDMRRNGLGGFLCGLVESEARRRGAQAIELWSDVKLLDAHRQYERLGYIRGAALKAYNDTSGTVRFYYRKALDADLPGRGRQPLFHPNAAIGANMGDRSRMGRLSFTEHPASVGENYFAHFRHAAGFSVSMLKGGIACMVHAIFPFLFTKTGSAIVASLNTRMVTNRHALAATSRTRKRHAAAPGKRTSAA